MSTGNGGQDAGVGFATARGRNWPTLRQFTVFLENRVGQLLEVVRRFDGSTGGIGGCPYAPGASGNIASEKLVALCAARGYRASIDEVALGVAARFIAGVLAGASSDG